MATKDQIFTSRFMKASDLKGHPLVVTIAGAAEETLKGTDGREKLKMVLTFKGQKKGLVSNLINWEAIEEITGETNSDDWVNHKVELYPTTTQMGGKIVDCIRVRRPPEPKMLLSRKAAPSTMPPAGAKSLREELDDDIPFGEDEEAAA
jgi:hypothetical protein